MRVLAAGIVSALLLVAQAPALMAETTGFSKSGEILKWMNDYRQKPEPERLPRAVHAMQQLGLFADQDKAGLYVGFAAGVLGDNQLKAESLVRKMFPMPPKDQAIIIKSIVYSGLPDWKGLLTKFVEYMPERVVLIDKYLFGDGKTLLKAPLDSGPEILETLWGYYIATGYYEPVSRIISALRWADEYEDLNKLTVGSMAKWTLAANAERDRELLKFYRIEVEYQPKKIAAELKDVIDATQAYRAERIRKKALEKIADLKQRNPNEQKKWAWRANVGSTLISMGCVAATVAGQPQIAAPCIVGGALFSGAAKLFSLSQ